MPAATSCRTLIIVDNKVASIVEQLQIGRLRFDGASRSVLATRFQINEADVDAAWLFCQEQLSRHFAGSDDDDYELLSDEALRQRSTECLRLLLDWQASLQQRDRLRALSKESGLD